MVEKITSRHYYTEEELIKLLGLEEECEIDNIREVSSYDIENNKDLEKYKCEVTTLKTIDYDDKEGVKKQRVS